MLAQYHSAPNPDYLIGRNIQRTLDVNFGEAEQAFEQKELGLMSCGANCSLVCCRGSVPIERPDDAPSIDADLNY